MSTRGEKREVRIKTYIVLLKDNLSSRGKPNVKILDVKLTAGAAQDIADGIAGAWVEKRIATK